MKEATTHETHRAHEEMCAFFLHLFICLLLYDFDVDSVCCRHTHIAILIATVAVAAAAANATLANRHQFVM